MKKLLLLFFSLWCFINYSAAKAGNHLTVYPCYEKVVYHFFTTYSLRNTNYLNLQFIKDLKGYSVQLNIYDTATKTQKLLKKYDVWSAAKGDYVTVSLPAAINANENDNLVKTYLSDYVECQHFNLDNYYGYPTWFKDVITDFTNYPVKTDSLLFALSDAYFNYAQNLRVTKNFYTIINYADTTGTLYETNPALYVKLVDSSLHYTKLLIAKNAAFETLESNAGNLYAIDGMTAWLTLTYQGFNSYAAQFINDTTCPFDSFLVNMGKNYLSSCAPHAILFTCGAEDTYPLLYVQKKLHFRTDVTVVNAILLGIDDYVKYISQYIPIDIPQVVYYGFLAAYYYQPYPENDYVSPDSLLVPVEQQILKDSTTCIFHRRYFDIKTTEFAYKDSSVNSNIKYNIVPDLHWILHDNPVLLYQMIILDVIRQNEWQRPIEFAAPDIISIYNGLDTDNIYCEGMVNRLFPATMSGTDNNNYNGILDAPACYDWLMNKLHCVGLDKNDSITDNIETIKYGNIVYLFDRTIRYYMDNNKRDTAQLLFNKLITALPPQHLRYYREYYYLVQCYYTFNQPEKARQLARAIANRAMAIITTYKPFDSVMKKINHDDILYTLYTIYYLEEIAQSANDAALAKEMNIKILLFRRLSGI